MWCGSTLQWMDGGLVVCRSIFHPRCSIMSVIDMTLILGSVLHGRRHENGVCVRANTARSSTW